MEKSIVRDLSSLNNSHLINNRSTFITTTFSDPDYELRKSRIQNLPSYRKENLSDRLNFVVVFQTIEIQRLSTEIEALRAALKDAELQAFNAGNYQVQIRELTEKCFCYDREREEYREENDKLNMICQRLYEELENLKNRYADIDPTIQEKYRLEKDRNKQLEQEIQKWKARCHAMEISKNRQLEDIRAMMESQRKSMLDREIKQLTLKFSSERQLLENQIRKLREIINLKDHQISNLSSHISRLEIDKEEMRHYESTIEEYENKFAMISQETIRLNDVLRRKQQEIERLNSNEQGLNRRIRELQGLLRQTENQNRVIDKYEDDIKHLRITLANIENEKKNYENQLAHIPYLQKKLQQISRQSQDLKDAHRSKLLEIDNLKNHCFKLESEQREKEERYKQQIPYFENKIAQLTGENERINSVLKNRAGEIDHLKNKNSDMEKKINNYIIIQEDKKKLENEINKQVREIEGLRNSVRGLENKCFKMDQLEKELRNYQEQKSNFMREIERLNMAVRNLSDEKQKIQRKNQDLERSLKTFMNIQEQLRVYKEKQINLTRELDRINGIINEKIKQIQKLKEYFYKIESSMEAYKVLEKKMIQNVSQTQKLIQELDDSRKQASFFQQKFLSAESAIKSLKNEIYTVSQQKDQVIKLVNRKGQELDVALNENQDLKSQIQNFRRVESQYRDLQQKFKSMESKYNESDKRLQRQQQKCFDLNNSLENSVNELNKIKREGLMSPQFKEQISLLESQFEKQEREYKSLLERFFVIQGILRKFKSAIGQNEQMNRRNNQKWQSVNTQLEKSGKGMKKMFQMQNQIIRLKEDNMNLEGRLRMTSFELETQNLKKSSISPIIPNSMNQLNYRKAESTFYLDNSTSQPKTVTRGERVALEPLSFRQNRQRFQFQLN